MTNDEARMTKGYAAVPSLFLSPLVGIPSSIVIRHSSFTSDIPRPDELADQPLSGALRAGVGAFGAVVLVPTAEDGRLGRAIGCCVPENIFCASTYKCPAKVTELAG